MGLKQYVCGVIVLILPIVSPVAFAVEHTLDSSNFAEIKFEIPGAPSDFTVTPHLMFFQLGGSTSGTLRTIELFDGAMELTAFESKLQSGGITAFVGSLEFPSLNDLTLILPPVDFTPIVEKTILGAIRVQVDGGSHSFNSDETRLNLFDCLTAVDVCTSAGFSPQPLITSIEIKARSFLSSPPYPVPVPPALLLCFFPLAYSCFRKRRVNPMR